MTSPIESLTARGRDAVIKMAGKTKRERAMKMLKLCRVVVDMMSPRASYEDRNDSNRS